MSIRNYTNTGQTSTLVAAIGATDTSFTLSNYAGDPTPPFTAALARGTATEEIVLVTAVSVSTVTVTRGYDGTSAQAQGAGATFQEVVVAQDFREANVHVNATSGVHGITGSVVGTSDTQTLTNKTLTLPALSSPTITGTATMASATVSGTLSVTGTTTLAALTLGSLSASGNATVGGTLGVTGATTLAGLTAASAAITGNATVGGTLGVTGASTLAAVTGTTITGSGLVKGAGVESTAGLTLAQIAAPSGVASKGQVWSQSDGGLYTRAGAGAVARVPVHWGAGTAFPGSGLIVGDTAYRSDLLATFAYNGAGWDQLSVPTVTSNTDRGTKYATPASIPEGFRIWHSGLKATQCWDSTNTKWRFTLSGTAGVTTDGSGLANAPHGGGQTPTSVVIAAGSQATDALSVVVKPLVWSYDATNFTVRVVRTDSSSYMGAQPLNFQWIATF